MDKFDELVKLAKKATPGPWRLSPNVRTNSILADSLSSAYGQAVALCQQRNEKSDNNAAYIAACSPEVILAALEEKEDMRRHIEGAYAALGDVNRSMYLFDHIYQLKKRAEQAEAATHAHILTISNLNREIGEMKGKLAGESE